MDAETQGQAAEGRGTGGEGPRSDAAPASGRKGKKKRPFWVELPVLVVIALGLALLIKSFVVQAFWIPSGSMENTLRIGDRILVNRVVYHLRDIDRGDIVVFSGKGSWGNDGEAQTSGGNPVSKLLGYVGLSPSGTDYIKRVIGLPGDTVSCAAHGAPVQVNGHPLNETSYLFKGAGDDPDSATGQDLPCDQAFGPVKVPAGRLWVMGDHRADSYDSRGHQQGYPDQGTIPESEVVGRAFVVIWPPGHWTFLSIPATFNQHFTSAAAPAVPLTLGLAGAFPLLWLTRRIPTRRSRR